MAKKEEPRELRKETVTDEWFSLVILNTNVPWNGYEWGIALFEIIDDF